MFFNTENTEHQINPNTELPSGHNRAQSRYREYTVAAQLSILLQSVHTAAPFALRKGNAQLRFSVICVPRN